MKQHSGLNLYWDRVSMGVCIECGLSPPKAPHLKRCADCLERVKEYNKNRRDKVSGIGRVTYRQRQKALPSVLEALEKLKGGVDGTLIDRDGAIVGVPVFDGDTDNRGAERTTEEDAVDAEYD
jgi:hypothetical protein